MTLTLQQRLRWAILILVLLGLLEVAIHTMAFRIGQRQAQITSNQQAIDCSKNSSTLADTISQSQSSDDCLFISCSGTL